MKVIFKTNLDWYNTLNWPVLTIPPRIGENVKVANINIHFCIANKIPMKLEIVDITYEDSVVNTNEAIAVCELWYRKVDTQFADQERLKHLYKQ